MRKAKVLYQDEWAGTLTEDEEGYHFQYEYEYLAKAKKNASISLTLPLKKEAFHSLILFPFFDGLIPEGWILDIVEKSWKINVKDRMGVLLVACKDCIGAVSIEPLL